MEFLKPIEKALEPAFKQPEMPAGGKKWFLTYLPVLALISGVLQVIAALGLWSAWNDVNEVVNLSNQFSSAFGVETAIDKPTLWFWLAIASIVVSAGIMFLSYTPLKEKVKKGWDYLFLGSLFSIVTSVFSLLVGKQYGGGVTDFAFSLIFGAIGFWILFQIKDGYLHHGKKTEKVADKK